MNDNTLDNTLKEGKLPPDLLESLLELTSREAGIEVEAAVGEDAAVVEGARRLVITADPITFTDKDIGVYTVAVNCNDIVAMGGEPRFLTTTLLLPSGTTEGRLRELFADLAKAARAAGVCWVGGHTEVTSAVNRIVVSGQAVGYLHGEPTTTAGARAGDAVVMTKWAGLEGTTVMARVHPEECRRILGPAGHEEVLSWLYDPGISIVREGRVLSDLTLSSAHDPTEGGIATGLREIAVRSKVGAVIEWERIPIREETERLCRRWDIDPLGLLSSGVFLFTAAETTAEAACRKLERAGLPAGIIGHITADPGDLRLIRSGRTGVLPEFARDEFLKIEP